jgi:DNA-binding protein Fis
MKDNVERLVEHILDGNIFLEEAIEVLEKSMIQHAMERTGGNQCEASKLLGIHRNTLQRKLVAYGLVNGRGRPRRKTMARQGRPRKPKSGAA